MKRLFAIAMALCLLVPAALATSIGTGIGINMQTEQFKPLVWLCDDRVVYDDPVQPGRITGKREPMVERINNYAFEGEQIEWYVLVKDKNGIEKIKDVYVTVGPVQGAGNDIEANCVFLRESNINISKCNPRILEENVQWDPKTMGWYKCILTVETPRSMYGEYWVTVEVEDLDGLSSTIDENEHWYLNPVIALSIDGTLDFGTVRPGTTAYSKTILVGNNADMGSGVLLDMFISGTDFYDPYSSGAKCPWSNVLRLSNFRYYVTNGAYNSRMDPRKDAEGYLPIGYGNGFNQPNPFYNAYEILQAGPMVGGIYYGANILAPGSKMPITFKLNLPEPCNGNFQDGQIYFWGEAI